MKNKRTIKLLVNHSSGFLNLSVNCLTKKIYIVIKSFICLLPIEEVEYNLCFNVDDD